MSIPDRFRFEVADLERCQPFSYDLRDTRGPGSACDLRIAINHTQFSSVGGSERYIHYLVQRLLKDGHEVHYFCSRCRDDFRHPRLIFHSVPRVRGVRFLKVLSFARHSAKRLRQAGPFDVVHGFSKTYLQDVYTDGSGLQSVYRDQMYGETSALKGWFGRRSPYQFAVDYCERKRFTRGNFSKILTMSRFVQEQIRDAYGLSEDEVEVLYNGIDTEEFSPQRCRPLRESTREELDIHPEDCVVLFVGSDYARKNLATLIEAAALLRDVEPLRFVICGRDRREEQYVEQAKALGVRDRFLFCGLQASITKYFGAADVFVLPSHYDVFGMVVLEAMASGVPPIVSAPAGASEIVEPGASGAILSDPKDASELARQLRHYQDVAVRTKAGEAARAAALRYSWDEHMKRLYEIYADVARTRSTERARALGGVETPNA